jgi:hypothetical protein
MGRGERKEKRYELAFQGSYRRWDSLNHRITTFRLSFLPVFDFLLFCNSSLPLNDFDFGNFYLHEFWYRIPSQISCLRYHGFHAESYSNGENLLVYL